MRSQAVFVLSIMLAGCASTARIDQFRSFADLGHKHQVALGSVVDQAVSSNIDANSQEILNAREQYEPKKQWPSPGGADEILDEQNQAVIATTRQYAAVRRHAALLDDYFRSLAALASYDSAPIAASTAATVEAIQGLSPTLQNLKVGNTTLPQAVSGLVPVVVNGIKGRLLDRELRQHGDVINRELELQERVLAFVAERIAADQELLAQRRILDKLAVPFGDLSKPLPADWTTARREILMAQAMSAEPGAEAAKVSRELGKAFLQLLEGKLSPEGVSSLATDLSRLLTLIEVVSAKASGGANEP